MEMWCAARHCVFESRPLRQVMQIGIIIQFAKLEKPIIRYLIIGFFVFYNAMETFIAGFPCLRLILQSTARFFFIYVLTGHSINSS